MRIPTPFEPEHIVVQAFQPALVRTAGSWASLRAGLKACTTITWLNRTLLGCVCLLVACVATPRMLVAAPTEQDVFKSIHDSVGERSDFDSRPIILLLVGGGALMLVFAAFNKRQQKTTPGAQKSMNHPGRLVKEVLREVPLRPAEMKQLKLLADSVQSQVGETPNPLTMILCPSLLAKGLSTNPGKIDRKAVAQVVRKMKLQNTPKS